jgi:hypothetical protein
MLMLERQCFTKTNETHLFQTQYFSRRVGGVSPRFVSSFGAMGTGHRGLHDCSGTHVQPLDILAVLVARNQELPTRESVLPGGESVPVAAVPPVLAPARAKGPAKP